jgi:2-polyprenyl-3-methyl-5-hydroxy-6-metoxy-1,4-benzoquinol methylase
MIQVRTSDTSKSGESLPNSASLSAAREADDHRVSCSLCGSAVVRKDSLNPGALMRAYQRVHHVNVAHLMQDVREIWFCECPNCGLRSFSPSVQGDGNFYAELAKGLDSFASKWVASHFPVDRERKEAAASPPRKAAFRAAPPTLLYETPWGSRQDFEFASGYIQAGMSVLEVGCGGCRFWDSIQQNIRSEIRYVGLEIDPAAVAMDVARHIDVRAELVEDHARAAAAQYDVVCFFQVLEHIVDLRSFLDARLCCLKPGGRLIFSLPNARSFLGHQPDNILNMPPHHVTWWTEIPIRYLAADLQLDVETIVEDILGPYYTRDFVKVLAMNYLRGLFKVRTQFELEGSSYRAWRYVAAIAARLLTPGLTGIGSVARGHSITAVLRKG